MHNEKLSTRVALARQGAAVERCHAHPHLGKYTVGQHSLDMVTLITLTWQEAHGGALPRAELLVAAAFHDVPERVVGDIPSPAKYILNGALDRVEKGILRLLGVDVELTPEEQQWLEIADGFELMVWSYEEAAVRGNKFFYSWVNHYLKKFGEDAELPEAWRSILALASASWEFNEREIVVEALKTLE